MADYREHHDQIRAAGASLVAISVDAPEKSEAVREELGLRFPLLCDTKREVVKSWGIYNAREKGGIAVPAIFILEHDRAVRFDSVDKEASRVSPREVVRLLREGAGSQRASRTIYVPGPGDWFRAIRNSFRLGLRSSRPGGS